eukprot:Pgem_evm1s8146
MLSGFILTYVRLSSSKPDTLKPWYLFVKDRVLSIYPLYFLSLLIAFTISCINGTVRFDSDLKWAYEWVASLFLLQAWIPSLTETVYQNHCWFLSAIVPYWALHNVAYRTLRKIPLYVQLIMLVVITILPYFLFLAIPAMAGVPLDWYAGHKYGSVETWADTLTIMIKFNPLFYFQIYVFGMICAFLFVDQRENPFIILKWGAVIGYTSLFLLFGLSAFYYFPGAKLVWRVGGLAPFQGLILIGLACGYDPIARVLGLWILRPLGNISYPQYIFQFIVWNIWFTKTEFGYWAVLTAFAICGYYFVQRTFTKKRSFVPDWKQGLYMLAILVVAALCFVMRDQSMKLKTHDGVELPVGTQSTILNDNIQDMGLAIQTDFLSPFKTLIGNNANEIAALSVNSNTNNNNNTNQPASRDLSFRIINPSLTCRNSSCIITARRHAITREDMGLKLYTNSTRSTWYSDLVIGKVDLNTLFNEAQRVATERPILNPMNYKLGDLPIAMRVIDIKNENNEWIPCKVTDNTTQFYEEVITTGPQDPRVFFSNDNTDNDDDVKGEGITECDYSTVGRNYISDLKFTDNDNNDNEKVK